MSEEEKEALLNLEHIVKHWKPDDENDELANIEYNSIKVAVELIDKLQKENEDMREELQMYVDTPINKLVVKNEQLQADKNKLINYIAVIENKTYEDVCKEFEIGE